MYTVTAVWHYFLSVAVDESCTLQLFAARIHVIALSRGHIYLLLIINIPPCQTPFEKVLQSKLIAALHNDGSAAYNRIFVYFHGNSEAALHLAYLLYPPLLTIPTSFVTLETLEVTAIHET